MRAVVRDRAGKRMLRPYAMCLQGLRAVMMMMMMMMMMIMNCFLETKKKWVLILAILVSNKYGGGGGGGDPQCMCTFLFLGRRPSSSTSFIPAGAHHFKRATPILNLCHGIFTVRSIFRLLFPRNMSALVFKSAPW